MKVIKFLKANKKQILKWGLIWAASIVGFFVLNKLATDVRRYNAIGGEGFMFLFPFLVWIGSKAKESIKEIKDELSR